MKLKKFEICISIFALIISIVTGIYTYRTSKEANELSAEAISIALGIVSELPKVEFSRANDDIIQFFNLENIK